MKVVIESSLFLNRISVSISYIAGQGLSLRLSQTSIKEQKLRKLRGDIHEIEKQIHTIDKRNKAQIHSLNRLIQLVNFKID
jgi:hypothetical protein